MLENKIWTKLCPAIFFIIIIFFIYFFYLFIYLFIYLLIAINNKEQPVEWSPFYK